MVKITGSDGKEVKVEPKVVEKKPITNTVYTTLTDITDQHVEKSDKKDFYKTEDGRPCYHQSTMKHYLRCPRSFRLAGEQSAEIGPATLRIMADGLIVEALVLGSKVGKGGKELADMMKGKKKPTIDKLESIAEQVREKKIFDLENGKSFVTAIHDEPEYRLEGEFDYIGPVHMTDWKGNVTVDFDEAIADCKLTGSIEWVWDGMELKEDYLQAMQYIYIHYKNTGRIVPFVYIIIENKYDVPIIKPRTVIIQKHDFDQWYLPFINMIHEDNGYVADVSELNCLGYAAGQKGSSIGRCWYLKYCNLGKYLLEQPETVEFTDLYSKNFFT